jgi:ubiquinone/menaquinone biosynthesis C-methylase UbiE
MKNVFRSPIDNTLLTKAANGYIDKSGNFFPIENGIPNFIYPPVSDLPMTEKFSLEWYKDNSDVYDEYLPITFNGFNVSEDVERQKMVNALDLRPDHKVLEFGAGSGRDSILIASRLGEKGELFLSDISADIFKHAVDKFKPGNYKPKTELFLANAYHLPVEDHYFDRVFHFGGINTFGDVKGTFREMIRVCKPGGKIVVGDENMPVWLRNTEFGKILMNTNFLYKDLIPFEALPVEARNVKVEWIMGGVFYYLSFDVGVGEPYVDFDFEIPGPRGGTHRTRFYGNLEGVSLETKELAIKARKKLDIPMYKWLDSIVRQEAEKILKNG